MNFNPKYILFGVITFIIIFLMNFLGNDAPDKLYRALLTAGVSAVCFIIGLMIYNKMGDKKDHQDFD